MKKKLDHICDVKKGTIIEKIDNDFFSNQPLTFKCGFTFDFNQLHFNWITSGFIDI